jgi:hypothetical protein
MKRKEKRPLLSFQLFIFLEKEFLIMKTEMITNLATSARRACCKGSLLLKKNSPTILMVAGIAGAVGATVLACRATVKASDILEDSKKNLDEINEAKRIFIDKDVTEEEEEEYEIINDDGSDKYTEDDYKKDIVTVYSKSAVTMLKLYGPAIIVGAAAIACLVGSNRILNKRNLAVTAAYNVVQNQFDKYRERVREDLGEDADYNYRYAHTTLKKGDVIHDKETGEDIVLDQDTDVICRDDYDGNSDYAVIFDEYSSTEWKKQVGYNRFFIQSQEQYANFLLHSRGYVILNEAYDLLGLPHTSAGQVVGWVDGGKDNYISFGLPNIHDAEDSQFERDFLLDFNVDGVIYDKIDKIVAGKPKVKFEKKRH